MSALCLFCSSCLRHLKTDVKDCKWEFISVYTQSNIWYNTSLFNLQICVEFFIHRCSPVLLLLRAALSPTGFTDTGDCPCPDLVLDILVLQEFKWARSPSPAGSLWIRSFPSRKSAAPPSFAEGALNPTVCHLGLLFIH